MCKDDSVFTLWPLSLHRAADDDSTVTRFCKCVDARLSDNPLVLVTIKTPSGIGGYSGIRMTGMPCGGFGILVLILGSNFLEEFFGSKLLPNTF